MTRRLWWLAVLVLAALALGFYIYGRNTCPPPGLWVRLFTDGNFGCVYAR